MCPRVCVGVCLRDRAHVCDLLTYIKALIQIPYLEANTHVHFQQSTSNTRAHVPGLPASHRARRCSSNGAPGPPAAPLLCVGRSLPAPSFGFSSMHGHCWRHTGPSASSGNPGPVTALTCGHHPLNIIEPSHRHPSSLRTAVLSFLCGRKLWPSTAGQGGLTCQAGPELGPGFVPFRTWRPCAPHRAPRRLPRNVFQHCLP